MYPALRFFLRDPINTTPTRPRPLSGIHAAKYVRGCCRLDVVVAVVVIIIATSTGAVLGGMEAGVNVQVVNAGRLEQEKVMVAPVVGVGVKVMCSVTDCPAVTLTEGTVGEYVKLSTGVMVVGLADESLPVLISPPPATVAVLVTEAGALLDTLTVKVIAG